MKRAFINVLDKYLPSEFLRTVMTHILLIVFVLQGSFTVYIDVLTLIADSTIGAVPVLAFAITISVHCEQYIRNAMNP